MVTSGKQQYVHQRPKSKMSIFLKLALLVTQASFVWHSETNNGLPNNNCFCFQGNVVNVNHTGYAKVFGVSDPFFFGHFMALAKIHSVEW
jgi:hypothetical protein